MLRHLAFWRRSTASTSGIDPQLDRSRGQVLIMFAGMLTVLIGMSAFVVDIAWIWSHELKVQRAADAGALAGVVWLPGNEPQAQAAAAEAVRANGYVDGVGGVEVFAREDPDDDNRILVDVSAPVDTFFMSLFGWDTVTVSRLAKAEYVLPVPMGSPENYYGVFGQVRTPSGGTWQHTFGDNGGWLSPTTASGSDWSNDGNVVSSNNTYAVGTDDEWLTIEGFTVSIPANKRIHGIEVAIESRWVGTDTTTNCHFDVSLSGDDGDDWTEPALTSDPITNTDPASPYEIVGHSGESWQTNSDSSRWGDNWSRASLSSGNFAVRIRNGATSSQCGSSVDLWVDYVAVRFHWQTLVPDANLTGPNGEVLNARGYWGTMLSQGSNDVNGDAYLPNYESRTSLVNPDYEPDSHYDYAVEMVPGSSNGEVWIFDPVFCATSSSGLYGTGDRFLETSNAVSAWYDLYDTKNTLFDLSDDTLVASSGNRFKNILAADTDLGGSSSLSSCRQGDVTDQNDGRYWHNRWWPLCAVGQPTSGCTASLQGGRTYRVRTTTTDPDSPTAGLSAGAQNSFAIWTTASGEAPDVYGIGAMEAYTPLKGGQAATFYLAQIDAIHAGKTVRIELWDPGDTQGLPATLQILIPTATGYTAATFDWTAEEGSNHSTANCLQTSGSGVNSIMSTTNGGVQQFQGCWVTIEVPIPVDYTAPQPPLESEPGWWKINYVMGGSTSNNAYDVTTWQVEIRGNPVHLVVP